MKAFDIVPTRKFLHNVALGIIFAFIAIPALMTMLFSQSSAEARTTFKIAFCIFYGLIAYIIYENLK